jgi:putative transposase
MPRLARLDAPGVLHHIIIRGIERRKIFRNDNDKDNLIDRLSILLPETQTACYAWALLLNHAINKALASPHLFKKLSRKL